MPIPMSLSANEVIQHSQPKEISFMKYFNYIVKWNERWVNMMLPTGTTNSLPYKFIGEDFAYLNLFQNPRSPSFHWDTRSTWAKVWLHVSNMWWYMSLPESLILALRYVDEAQDNLMIDALCKRHCSPLDQLWLLKCWESFAAIQMDSFGLGIQPRRYHLVAHFVFKTSNPCSTA